MSIYCQACNDEKHGVKGSPMTVHTCKGLDAPFMPNWTSKPGRTIQDILDERKWTLGMFAHYMGFSVVAAARLIMAITEIDETIAQKLAHVFGNSKEFWLNREKQYRADKIRLGEE